MKTYSVNVFMAIFWLCSVAAAAQVQVQVSGQITDTSARPLAYASVGVVGKPVGTVADVQGHFIFYVTEQIELTDTVQDSLIGYQPRLFTVAEFVTRTAKDPHIALNEAVRRLNEVRINAKDSKVTTATAARTVGGNFGE